MRELRTTWIAVAMAAVAWSAGCGKGEPTAAPGAATPSADDEAPAERVSASIAVESRRSTPGVTVSLNLPSGWAQHEFFENRWVPRGVQNPMEVFISAGTSCGGACEAARIPEQIVAEMKRTLEAVRDGVPGMGEHFKGEVEILAEGELSGGGRFHAYRATYPQPPAGDGDARPTPGTFVHCYLHNDGDDFYVLVEAQAQAQHEARIWPALETSCAEATYAVAAAEE